MPTLAAAFEELLHIGIEKRLTQLQIKGEKYSPRCCVISKYLQLYCGDPSARVGTIVASRTNEPYFQAPTLVQQFIADFDLGLYPALVMESDYAEA